MRRRLILFLFALSLVSYSLTGCGDSSGDVPNTAEGTAETAAGRESDETGDSAKMEITRPEQEAAAAEMTGPEQEAAAAEMTRPEQEAAAAEMTGPGQEAAAEEMAEPEQKELIPVNPSDWVGEWKVVRTNLNSGEIGEEGVLRDDPRSATVFNGLYYKAVIFNEDFTGTVISSDGSTDAFIWEIKDSCIVNVHYVDENNTSSFVCFMKEAGQIEMLALKRYEENKYTSYIFCLSKNEESGAFPYDSTDAEDVMDDSLLRGHWDICTYMQADLCFQGDLSILKSEGLLETEYIPSLELNEDGTGVFTSFFEEREITWTVGENGAVVSLGETDLSLKRLEDMLLLVSPGNENGDMYYYFEKKAE